MLQAKSLSYAIDNKLLIRDININFHPGSLYGILGPNGSGKSTFLKTLTGIWKPASGFVLWNQEDLLARSRNEISRTVALVPQNPQVNFDFSVTDMVAMGRYPYRSHRQSAEKMDLLEHVLKTVDVYHLRDRSILKLSHGERKRVYIARALITESPILLLDEPASGLDIKHQIEIWLLLKRLVQEGKIIAVTTHDLAATERYCDQVAIMHNGRCIAQGSSEEVFTHDLLEKVFGVRERSDCHSKHYDIIST